MVGQLLEGEVSFEDDWVLWRRINPEWLTNDENEGRISKRPSSQNFTAKDSKLSPVSLYIAHECKDPKRLLHSSFSSQYIAGVTGQQLRERNLRLKRVSRGEDLRIDGFVIDGHVEVVGPDKTIAKLARVCYWVIGPSELSTLAW
jgi:hypothetical protein